MYVKFRGVPLKLCKYVVVRDKSEMPLITLLLNKTPKCYVNLPLQLLLKKLECFTNCIMVLLVYGYFLTPLQLRHKDSRSIARK